ncbi:chitobiase/beta-hexosaminidase C-terminal domain-containing protein [Hwangdonia lutea]|uniref:Chitobiase/beta-hexosaminidase C-terminal domain-containing protein n=1 Tax=Hwangdonia lutea TaxID=3075823 RepID=A0AA97HQR3_9FLAO|nr:chitobiase/beta-hexosaminidase C-terminal domain-containing protein [Hwangdonia sp. SCSIO 19198]WOD42663.1 chitobiase/beta-hexosaminidase C-terminal domain-containing protein [Hwangdonia sp. SCSIO 19198]
MRLLMSLYFMLVLMVGCKHEKQPDFLQQNTISLAQPRVTTNKTFIDSFVTIQAQLKVDDVVIRYTSNGEEPSLNSEKYTQPIQAVNPGIYKFKAFHNHWKSSEVTKVELFKKGLSADGILWHTKASEKYNGQGEKTLINQTKATLNFTDSQWVGFDTTAVSTITFNKKIYVKSLTISYLNDAASWIFPPKSIIIFINDDLKEEHVLEPLSQTVAKKNETKNITVEAEVESLKIQVNNLQSIPEWHEGKGQNAWLFMDEFIFN